MTGNISHKDLYHFCNQVHTERQTFGMEIINLGGWSFLLVQVYSKFASSW